MHEVEEWSRKLLALLKTPIFEMGGTAFTLWALLQILLLVVLLIYLSGKLRGWMAEHLLVRTRLDMGAR